MRNEKLIEYIETKMTDQGMSRAELSRRSGVSKPAISKLLNGDTPNPQPETLKYIAKGLNIPDEKLLRLAGYLDPKPQSDLNFEEANYILANLPPEDQEEAIEYLRMKARIAEQRGEYATQGTMGETP